MKIKLFFLVDSESYEFVFCVIGVKDINIFFWNLGDKRSKF